MRFRPWMWGAVAALASVTAWLLVGRVPMDFFLAPAMSFAGVDEATARPIVARLYSALTVGLTIAPWLPLLAYCGFKSICNHRERLDQVSVFAVALTVISLLSLPYPVMPAVPGLDNSWQWLLNRLAFTTAFGRETVFTYGPLGFLLCPQAPLTNVLTALAANVCYAVLWAFALTALYRSDRANHAAAWTLMVTMMFPQSNMEWRWVALAVILVALPVVAPCIRCRRALLAGGGIVLAVVSFMKFSSLVVVAATQAFCLGAIILRERRWRAVLLPWAVASGVVASVIAYSCFESWSSFEHWCVGSMQIASGYNKYMVVPKSWLELAVPFFFMGSVLVTLLRGVFDRRRVLVFGLVLSPVFFCTAKYALVRQGALPLLYLLSVFCALALCMIPQLRRRIWGLMGLFMVVTYACTLPRAIAGETFWHFAFGTNPMGLIQTLTLQNSLCKASEMSAAKVEPTRLPEAWRELIGTERVTFLPHEYGPAMGNDKYNIAVLPSFQLYSGYLPSLDTWNAAFFAEAGAPRWIVCNVDPQWSGHFIDHPAMWNMVLSRYQVVAEDEERLLLRRRDGAVTSTSEVSRQICVQADRWVDCHDWASLRIAIMWKPTLLGKACTFFLRNTLTFLSLRYDDGTEATVQLLPENLGQPFSLAKVCVTGQDFADILKGGTARRPRSIRFHAMSSACYSSSITVITE